ncbi:MAG: Holliday junction ATP-dependent DNA helicase RuvA [Thermonema sp.]|jgi:Holliday junction DNA helicase RuvA|uniref:Holliday junction branch migration protein RuvA n=1 Tax=Thermonema TaxID=28194 RepID=UPI00056E4F58|nr:MULTISPECIES: Holliday junction branch migration protein RuvA [Thermonema]GIV39369.1 MAG: Holliday junction ATP-dependent DNA helicase RuvA [Thermonema sp.]
MFAYIRGVLVQKEPTHVVLDVQGVGYFIKISLHTYAQISAKKGEEQQLYVHFHVQENAHSLYGFASVVEKELFLMLMSVSGIGANTALMMLSAMNPQELTTAIAQEDVKRLKAIKGIGEKTAMRAVVELKDKVRKQMPEAVLDDAHAQPYYRLQEEAVQALVVLGLPKATAEKNVRSVLKNLKGEEVALEELIKRALNV